MPNPIQRGELNDRLRRFFAIVGGEQFTIDSLVSPIVQLQNLDRAPYRTDPVGFRMGSLVPNIAGQFGFGGITNPASGARSGAAYIWLEECVLSGGASPLTVNMRMSLTAPPAPTLQLPLQNTDRLQIGGAQNLVPGEYFHGSNVAALGAPIGNVVCETNAAIVVPIRVGLFPGDTFFFEGITVARDFQTAFSGLVFRQI